MFASILSLVVYLVLHAVADCFSARAALWLRRAGVVVLVIGVLFAISCVASAQEPATWRIVQTLDVQECYGQTCRVTRYDWRQRDDCPGQSFLFAAGVQVGGWDHGQGHFRPYHAATATWLAAQPAAPLGLQPPAAPAAPVAPADPRPPEFGQAVDDGVPNFGIDRAKLREGKREGFHYERNGKKISREEALQAFEALPDDADHLRVTFVGPKDGADKLQQDLEAAGWKGKVHVQHYESVDEPMIRGKGFRPGLQVEAPDGRRLGAEDASPGAEQLAEGLRIAERRRRDPDWRPPDWRPLRERPHPVIDGFRNAFGLLGWLLRNWSGVLIVIVLFGAALLLRRPQAR